MAMLKGQVKSAIIDVQKEFDKIGGYTIEKHSHLTEYRFGSNLD